MLIKKTVMMKKDRTPESLTMTWECPYSSSHTFIATPKIDEAYQETKWLIIPE